MEQSQTGGATPPPTPSPSETAYTDWIGPEPVVIPPSAEQVDIAVRSIKSRISWASLHWGTEHVHPDAWPHIARAALGPVLADLEKSSSAPRSETPDPVDALEVLATAASPGLWEVNDAGDMGITLDKGTALTKWNDEGTVGYAARSWRTTDRMVEIDPQDFTEDEVEDIVADLEYIAAARPEVVLALIERLRRAEAHTADAVAAERARAAAHAREGYRGNETCDDIEKRILSGEPAADQGDQQ